MEYTNITTPSDTDNAYNLTLQEINDLQARRMYPVIGFLLISGIIGVFGNSLVFCVYYTRFKRTPTNLLILVLSVFDALTAVIQIPFEIVDLWYPYMYGDVMYIPCKIFRFTGATLITGSALTICAIALERYKKISDPLNPLGKRTTMHILIACITYVVVLSFPMIFQYGYHTEDLSSYGVSFNGSDCAVDDRIADTYFPRVFGGIFLFHFFIFFTCYAYFYIRIAIIVHRRKTKSANIQISHSNGGFSANEDRLSRELSSSTPSQIDTVPSNSRRTSIAALRAVSGVKIHTVKLTVMFLVISVVCVLSFLPVLTFDVLNAFIHFDEYRKGNAALDVALEFCQKTFCLNTCSNPIIYSIMNPSFRKACADIFKYRCNKNHIYRQQSKLFTVGCGPVKR